MTVDIDARRTEDRWWQTTLGSTFAIVPAPVDIRPQDKLGSDFRKLWGAYSASELGSAIGSGALPLIALLVLKVGPGQVSLLAALSGIVSALVALPMGTTIEFRRKRPVMIAADLIRFAALGSVPLAAALGRLTYAHLCLVGVLCTSGGIAFNAASGAHLKNLVPPALRIDANSRFETTFWTATTIGPPVGGALISWLGATSTIVIDAFSFLLSAVGVGSLRSSEPSPPDASDREGHWRADVTAGWRYIFGHGGLRALFCNAMVFGGCVMMASPLLAVLMLRDLGFTPWQYGLALGVPGVGGVMGAMCTKRLTRRFGSRTVLLTFGVGRTLWLGLLPLAPHGTGGLVLIMASEFMLLFCAGVFNPTFVTYRMRATPDSHMSRVSTAWSVGAKTAQPIFTLAGGVLAAATSTRISLMVGASILLTSAALLPWSGKSASGQPWR